MLYSCVAMKLAYNPRFIPKRTGRSLVCRKTDRFLNLARRLPKAKPVTIAIACEFEGGVTFCAYTKIDSASNYPKARERNGMIDFERDLA